MRNHIPSILRLFIVELILVRILIDTYILVRNLKMENNYYCYLIILTIQDPELLRRVAIGLQEWDSKVENGQYYGIG